MGIGDLKAELAAAQAKIKEAAKERERLLSLIEDLERQHQRDMERLSELKSVLDSKTNAESRAVWTRLSGRVYIKKTY